LKTGACEGNKGIVWIKATGRGRVDLKSGLEANRTNIWSLKKRDGIKIQNLGKHHCLTK